MVPASVILQQLREKAPADHVTAAWVISQIDKQSFGLIMLALAVLAATPGISIIGGLLLLIVASQMVIGFQAPRFPTWIASRPLPTRHLDAVMRRATPLLKRVEALIHPRRPASTQITKRAVGIILVLLAVRLLLNPLPLSNVVPALLIAVIAIAYFEEDGLILILAMLAAAAVLIVDLWGGWLVIRAHLS